MGMERFRIPSFPSLFNSLEREPIKSENDATDLVERDSDDRIGVGLPSSGLFGS